MVVRNSLYQSEILSSHSYEIPVIGVGNLRVGGTGKTPMIEYLISLLCKEQKLAMLSRGYGRKTSGYHLGTLESTAVDLGDEPAQVKSKFPDIAVAVDGDRVNGIRRLLSDHSEVNAILLDDVYQHRAVKPGLMILLTAYGDLYLDDLVLPAGRLREPKASAARADIIVVTKCPENLSVFDRRSILGRINAKSHQQVFFTTEQYGEPYAIIDKSTTIPSATENVILLTGIARAATMKDYLEKNYTVVEHFQYGDHYWYTEKDLQLLRESLNKLDNGKTIIITTEKDAQRLLSFMQKKSFANIPIFALPMKIEFLGGESQAFNNCLHEFIRSHK